MADGRRDDDHLTPYGVLLPCRNVRESGLVAVMTYRDQVAKQKAGRWSTKARVLLREVCIKKRGWGWLLLYLTDPVQRLLGSSHFDPGRVPVACSASRMALLRLLQA